MRHNRGICHNSTECPNANVIVYKKTCSHYVNALHADDKTLPWHWLNWLAAQVSATAIEMRTYRLQNIFYFRRGGSSPNYMQTMWNELRQQLSKDHFTTRFGQKRKAKLLFLRRLGIIAKVGKKKLRKLLCNPASSAGTVFRALHHRALSTVQVRNGDNRQQKQLKTILLNGATHKTLRPHRVLCDSKFPFVPAPNEIGEINFASHVKMRASPSAHRHKWMRYAPFRTDVNRIISPQVWRWHTPVEFQELFLHRNECVAFFGGADECRKFHYQPKPHGRCVTTS